METVFGSVNGDLLSFLQKYEQFAIVISFLMLVLFWRLVKKATAGDKITAGAIATVLIFFVTIIGAYAKDCRYSPPSIIASPYQPSRESAEDLKFATVGSSLTGAIFSAAKGGDGTYYFAGWNYAENRELHVVTLGSNGRAQRYYSNGFNGFPRTIEVSPNGDFELIGSFWRAANPPDQFLNSRVGELSSDKAAGRIEITRLSLGEARTALSVVQDQARVVNGRLQVSVVLLRKIIEGSKERLDLTEIQISRAKIIDGGKIFAQVVSKYKVYWILFTAEGQFDRVLVEPGAESSKNFSWIQTVVILEDQRLLVAGVEHGANSKNPARKLFLILPDGSIDQNFANALYGKFMPGLPALTRKGITYAVDPAECEYCYVCTGFETIEPESYICDILPYSKDLVLVLGRFQALSQSGEQRKNLVLVSLSGLIQP